MIVTNIYPWPPKELSPNARVFWRKKNPIKAKYRDTCQLITKSVSLNEDQIVNNVKCNITFHPPDSRQRDLDNILAMCKPLLDGMCRKLGVNDKNIMPININFGPKRKNGEVKVDLYF